MSDQPVRFAILGLLYGVHIGEDDWRSIQETLNLLSIPGMRELIREALETPLEGTDKHLDPSDPYWP